MAEKPIDLEAIRSIDAKIDRVLETYPELQAANPERLRAWLEWLENLAQGRNTMAHKATGKTRGRPKTKEYKTLLSRVPQDLAELAERYAKQHGQSISELIREGLEWRIGDGDPRSNGLYLAEPMGINEKVYDSNTGNNTVASEQSDSATLLSAFLAQLQANSDRILQEVLQDSDKKVQEVLRSLTRQDDKLEALLRELARPSVLANNDVYSSNTENAPSVVQDVMVPRVKIDKEEVLVRIQQMRDEGLDSAQITKELQAEGVPTLSAEAQLQAVVEILEHRAIQDGSEGDTGITSADGVIPVASMEAQSTLGQAPAGEDTRGNIPSYDPAKHHLGKLCKRDHEWGSTGLSLKNTDNQCLECKALAKREKDAKKRAEREAQPVSG